MLESLPPAPLDSASLPRVLSRIEAQERFEKHAASLPPSLRLPGGIDLPQSLKAQKVGSWHYIPPSLHWSRVELRSGEGANIVLLQIGAGTKVPRHGHAGTEYTLVLAGAFSDENGHYLPGDLIEADDTIDHQPVVDSFSDCLCIAAIAGKLRFHSVFGRMMQPLIGI
jgi:putative transcriptional regulator